MQVLPEIGACYVLVATLIDNKSWRREYWDGVHISPAGDGWMGGVIRTGEGISTTGSKPKHHRGWLFLGSLCYINSKCSATRTLIHTCSFLPTKGAILGKRGVSQRPVVINKKSVYTHGGSPGKAYICPAINENSLSCSWYHRMGLPSTILFVVLFASVTEKGLHQ